MSESLIGTHWRGRPGEEPVWWEGRLFRVTRAAADGGLVVTAADRFSGLEFTVSPTSLERLFARERPAP